VRVATTITVAHGSDLDALIPLLESLPASVTRVLVEPGPGVSLNKLGTDGYELELGFWISDPENGRGGVISEVNTKIYALVKAGRIKLASSAMDPRLQDALIASTVAGISQSPAK
jgi:small-conductance mechanosensitive channel